MPEGVVIGTIVLMAIGTVGLRWLRVDTNHINFFAKDHPLTKSATLIDQKLSGIYSFNILLEGEPDSMKSPDALRRMEELRERLQRLPFVRKVVSVADYVKRVNRELNGGDESEAVVPAGADAIAQELFVFGLSDEGRRELDRVVASDYSRAQISVKLASMSSDLVFEQINRAEEEANAVFAGSGITPTVTGSGRMFATLDHYIVVSQLSSFGTAFLTVFARDLRRVPVRALWCAGDHRERAAGLRGARRHGLARHLAERRDGHGGQRRAGHRGRRHDSLHRPVPA